MELVIRQASTNNIDDFLLLFDAYRVFHHSSSDIEGARAFLTLRLESKEATVFIAQHRETNTAIGFVLLYQTYSNHSMKRVFILNDLFTLAEYRGQGVAQTLIQKAIHYARENNAGKLRLFTTKENFVAKNLYEHLGFIHEQGFDMYELIL
jgi:ribosomal protein S18 acetylase RimI-like enzyme